MKFLKKIIRWFDKAEDMTRYELSHIPVVYALIGGITIVVFWRGVWHTADILMSQGGFWSWFFYEPITIVWTAIILLATGLFISFFIGDTIIISGLRHDKKTIEKTENEIKTEIELIKELTEKVESIENKLKEISDFTQNR